MGVSERWEGHPPLPPDLEERLPAIVERLRAGGAGLVYVFGSAARVSKGDSEGVDGQGSGSDGQGSGSDRTRRPPQDVDLAVWGLEENLDRLRPDIEDLLGTDRFDLVRMEEADPELRFEIVAHGQLLYAGDAKLENRVEVGVLREYQDLAPFRRKQRDLLRRRHGVRGS